MLRAASEACRAAWSLINVLDVHAGQKLWMTDKIPCLMKNQQKMVDVITRAFLRSEVVQVAVYYCFHQRIESTMVCGLQLLSNSSLSKDAPTLQPYFRLYTPPFCKHQTIHIIFK